MAIEFRCEACGKTLRTSKPNMVGKKVRCPGCKGIVVVKPADQGEAIQPPPQKGGPPPMPPQPKPSAVERPRPPRLPASDMFEDEGPPPDMPRAPRRRRPPSASPEKRGIDALAIIIGLLVVGYLAAMGLVMFGVVGAAPKVIVAEANGLEPGPFGPGPIGPGPINPKPKKEIEPKKEKPLPSPPPAGKPVAAKGSLDVGVHRIETDPSHVYEVNVKGEGFRPVVRMKPDRLRIKPDRQSRDSFDAVFIPAAQDTQTIRIVPDFYDLKGTGPYKYSLKVTPITMSPKPILEKQGTLEKTDPAFRAGGKHHKSYDVKMQAGKYYRIDMRRRANDFLNCRLYITEDVKVIAKDSDFGIGVNSQLVFRPVATDTYKIIATGHSNSVGDFTLTVYEQSDSPPKSKPIDIADKIDAAVHAFRPRPNDVNVIEIECQSRSRKIRMSPGSLPKLRSVADNPLLVRGLYVAKNPDESQRIYISPNIADNKISGPIDYSINIRPVEMEAKPMVDVKESMANNFPPIDIDEAFSEWKHHKVHKLKLVGGKVYVAHMKLQRPQDFMSCRLAVLDQEGKAIALGKRHGLRNSMLTILAPATGDYSLVTAASDQSVAPYHLTVFSQAGDPIVVAKKDPTAKKELPPLPKPGTPIDTKGKIQIGFHDIRMKADELYVVKVQGSGFYPRVEMFPDRLRSLKLDDGLRFAYWGEIVAAKDSKQTLRILPNVYEVKNTGPYHYTLNVESIPLDPKPLLEKQGSLTAKDPPFKMQFGQRKHFAQYTVKLEADKYYVIDMKKRGKSPLDCYLLLMESFSGFLVESDDDGGDDLNSQIVLRPRRTQYYEIIATGLGDAVGDYTLTVRKQGAGPPSGKPLTGEHDLYVGFQQFQPKSKQLNLITAHGAGFRPVLRMRPGALMTLPTDFKNRNLVKGQFMPEKADKVQTIVVIPDVFNLKSPGPFDFSLKIDPVALAAKPMLAVKGELTKDDPPVKIDFSDRKHHKAYELKLTAGKYYVVEMQPKSEKRLNCGMAFLDQKNKVIVRSYGYGGGKARIVFQAPQSETYRLIAYIFNTGLGAYELTVREQARSEK